MTDESDIYLNADSEDLADALEIIEESYNIRFVDGELKDIKTFGQLCDQIISKIQLTDKDDCTTQQAIYKLRDAMTNSMLIEGEQVKTETSLSVIFPKPTRKVDISKVEDLLGFKLHVLRPKHLVSNAIMILLLTSCVGMFFNFIYGIIGFILGIILFRISDWTGNEFKVNTIGQLADKLSQENYIKSRRNKTTVNRKEILKNIEKLFIEVLLLDLKEIKRETLIA